MAGLGLSLYRYPGEALGGSPLYQIRGRRASLDRLTTQGLLTIFYDYSLNICHVGDFKVCVAVLILRSRLFRSLSDALLFCYDS